MTATTTPLASGTDVGETIGTKLYGRSLLADTAGTDAMGVVGASPGATTILGRLKAVTDALLGGIAVTGTFFQATQPVSAAALPLPTGASTSALQTALNTLATAISANTALVAPITNMFTIAPNDTATLATTTRGIYVGGAGDITLRGSGAAADVLLKAVPVGAILPIQATNIRATGTTATQLVGLA